ncbi:hypothetical protein EVAR_4080_1 [Eumeta japonica]|uniref:Uncharacterized protein n=1 Tax=Eumeta variegata TaxID=151549 RepID=A0A4C1T3X7_EUMVA|nr:hypothetical protein EVAR_4080_1 [Eumeta japonica]
MVRPSRFADSNEKPASCVCKRRVYERLIRRARNERWKTVQLPSGYVGLCEGRAPTPRLPASMPPSIVHKIDEPTLEASFNKRSAVLEYDLDRRWRFYFLVGSAVAFDGDRSSGHWLRERTACTNPSVTL